MSGLKFLARQGCGIQGHDDNDGNLLQCLGENDANVILLTAVTYNNCNKKCNTFTLYYAVSGVAKKEV